MESSSEIMATMSQLIKIPEIKKIATNLAKEMTKVIFEFE